MNLYLTYNALTNEAKKTQSTIPNLLQHLTLCERLLKYTNQQ